MDKNKNMVIFDLMEYLMDDLIVNHQIHKHFYFCEIINGIFVYG